MTNILVPTDFTPASLKMAEGILKKTSIDKCNLVLFHAFELPSSPIDLLFRSYTDPSCEVISETFRQACKQVKNEHSKKVNKIIVRCMTGNTRAVFKNFAEANDIDLIYCPESYVFKKVHQRSVNPVSLFTKCGIPIIKSVVTKSEKEYSLPGWIHASISTQTA